MRMLLISAFTAALTLSPTLASAQATFKNPCERGPWPKVDIINDTRAEFVAFLQSVRPAMPPQTAVQIGHELCDDLSIVGDSNALSQRLNMLIRHHGY